MILANVIFDILLPTFSTPRKNNSSTSKTGRFVRHWQAKFHWSVQSVTVCGPKGYWQRNQEKKISGRKFGIRSKKEKCSVNTTN
jgi:hypothetical protein